MKLWVILYQEHEGASVRASKRVYDDKEKAEDIAAHILIDGHSPFNTWVSSVDDKRPQ